MIVKETIIIGLSESFQLDQRKLKGLDILVIWNPCKTEPIPGVCKSFLSLYRQQFFLQLLFDFRQFAFGKLPFGLPIGLNFQGILNG